jgi:uncharacterized membrane protein
MKALREGLAALGVLFTAGVVIVHYGSLPQRMPIHFNAQGVVNGWGDKSSLWMMPGLVFILYIVMTLVPLISPSMIHLPVSAEKREAAAPIAMEMVGWLKAEIVWTFAILCVTMVRVGMGRTQGLGPWFAPVELVIVFGTVGFYLWRIRNVAA